MRLPALVLLVLPVVASCGGGGGASPPSTSPTPVPNANAVNACGAIAATSIVNGSECSTAGSRIVLLSLRDAQGAPVGACSGTIVAPRAILTAAHCLDEETRIVRVWLGPGSDLIDAVSFVGHPDYHAVTTTNAPDVGVVFMKEDLGREPVPILLSRTGKVGEQAVIAGWGLDQNGVAPTHRAGATTLTAVGSLYLQTQNSAAGSSICQGDSGGPLLLQQDGAWAVAGVAASSSEPVCTMGTNYYVSVRHSAISSFILEHVPDVPRR